MTGLFQASPYHRTEQLCLSHAPTLGIAKHAAPSSRCGAVTKKDGKGVVVLWFLDCRRGYSDTLTETRRKMYCMRLHLAGVVA